MLKLRRLALFAGGVLFGTAGIKALSSTDAKKVYTGALAATLRAKDYVVKTATNVQENAEDILSEAKEINEQRRQSQEAADFMEPEESDANPQTIVCEPGADVLPE